ncbi:hypothetical protein Tco_1054812 [Tanacetum coccineum]|uniref:Uncharacterized protein n=1 Tax=Tanacetum coccineum TaxID=301880 RepID=A0ABQ5GYK8_9ASTR
MATTAAQQVALDNALVPLEKRVEIGKCNIRIDPAKTQKEPTYQVVFYALALTTCYPAVSSQQDSSRRIYNAPRNLSRSVVRLSNKILNKLIQMTKLSPSLRNLATKEMLNLSLKWLLITYTNHGELLLQSSTKECGLCQTSLGRLHISNREQRPQEARKDDDNILGTMRFVSKFEDFQIYEAVLPNRMTNQQIRDFDAYKTYLAYATGASSPKMKRKLKKPASPSKKRTLVIEEEEEHEPAKKDKPTKKPATKRQSSGGADFEIEVLDEPKDKSVDTHKGIGLKPGVLDVSIADSFESETESWGDSESDDEEEETQDDEYVHTLDDYVPTEDEMKDETDDVTEEEYERINEELYGDVNVSLTDVEPADKEKDDEEITVAGYMNINQEGASNQVKDDAQATQKTEGPILSSSISSDYAAKYLNFDNIPPVDTEVVSMLDIDVQHEVSHTSPLLTIQGSTTSIIVVSESETLATLQLRVPDLEKDIKELKYVDNITKVTLTIQSKVPKAVKEYLGSSLDDAIHKVIHKNVADIIKEHSVPVKTVKRLRQQYAP